MGISEKYRNVYLLGQVEGVSLCMAQKAMLITSQMRGDL
jgi:hypothetical protein